MKIFIITNKETIDGAGCVVLTKALFNSPDDEVTYGLFDAKTIHYKLRDMLKNGSLNKYDLVLLTGVYLKRDILESIDASPLRDKVAMVDHNRWALENDDFDWTFIERYWDERKASATNLLLEWFKYNFEDLQPTEGMNEFVELTRQVETGEQDMCPRAEDLMHLFNEVGSEEFIESFSAKLNAFYNLYFDRFDRAAIEANKEREKK